jgi:hypothetical protein
MTLCKEIIAVYSQNRKKSINALCMQNADTVNAKIDGATISNVL